MKNVFQTSKSELALYYFQKEMLPMSPLTRAGFLYQFLLVICCEMPFQVL